MVKKGLLERLALGPVICAEGYVFEMERRGYVSAGVFVPEVVLEHPEALAQLHREFLRAGSDVIEAFTYYAHREKLRLIGLEDQIESLNRAAIGIARGVAAEGDALVAGNICNTNIYNDTPAVRAQVRAMFEEQVGWAVDEGVDFIIAETLSHFGEAKIALETIQQTNLPSVVTIAMHRSARTLDGMDTADCLKALEDAGADVVGLNCMRGPETILPLLSAARRVVNGHLAALPVPYRTTPDSPTFHGLRDPHCDIIPDGRPFPLALDPFTCNRFEIAAFAQRARDLGVTYLGLCCGAAPHHVRSLAEALGRRPEASRYSPDMSKHAFFGTDERIPEEFKNHADKL